eukprot:CAMPEP_0197131652 /NCGR_PEP_ID=MMETSP1390-20130617/22281_1 /TAXON_ID=38833 /ORGANISM="Micromonas sp., Strain CCMP2099" /LENGTH=63 /DNA_ID=CAMNT_0042574233 /DNA_START=252 /DNA_END=439 /DNA_ORIENTATION=-
MHAVHHVRGVSSNRPGGCDVVPRQKRAARSVRRDQQVFFFGSVFLSASDGLVRVSSRPPRERA